MKKIVITILSLALSTNMVYAGQVKKLSENSRFDTVSWQSNYSGDDVTIEGPVNSQYSYMVQISPIRDGSYGTGVNVRNCDNITHINVGSSAICMLSQRNPVIIFSSDKDNVGAFGFYQIEKS